MEFGRGIQPNMYWKSMDLYVLSTSNCFLFMISFEIQHQILMIFMGYLGICVMASPAFNSVALWYDCHSDKHDDVMTYKNA